MTDLVFTDYSPDWIVVSHGSLILFTPNCEAANDHADAMFGDAMMFGAAYVVEARYARDIIADLLENEGFSVELDGQTVETEHVAGCPAVDGFGCRCGELLEDLS